jgi:adenylylsulfate kinase
MIVWIIGLAGAGKTTLGQQVRKVYGERSGRNAVLIDGDSVREILGADVDYSREGRIENGRRIAALCQMLDRQHLAVVCSVLSISEEHRDTNRMLASRYLEVFIDVPLDILRQRDQKALYSGFASKRVENVVGLDIPFDRPQNPDLVIHNVGEESFLLNHADEIVSWMMRADD